MKLDDIVAHVATTSGMKGGEVQKIVDAVFASIQKAVESGEKVNVPGLGTFHLKEREAGERVDPKTGEKRAIPAAKYTTLKPSRSAAGKPKKGGKGDKKGANAQA